MRAVVGSDLEAQLRRIFDSSGRSTSRVVLDLLDAVPFGVGLLSASDLTFVYANPTYESWFAPRPGPLVGRRLEDALESAPHVVGVFRNVVRAGEPVHFHGDEFVGLKMRPVTLPGDVTLWDWSLLPLRERGGAVTHLLVIGVDVTAPAVDRLRLRESHEQAIHVLLEVSRTVDTSGDLSDFFGRLTETVAQLVSATKVMFARWDGEETLAGQPRAFGFPDRLLDSLAVPCSPEGGGLADGIVFGDEVFRADLDSDPLLEPYRGILDMMEVSNAAAVSWRAGDIRLGILAAFNSSRAGGFSEGDVDILRMAAMAAGLVWQHWQAAARLEDVQARERLKLEEDGARIAALEAAKSDFLRLASHELRGPIAVVRGYLSMLEDRSVEGVSGPALALVPVLSDKMTEISNLVDQMLETARLEDGATELEMIELDLREVISEAARECERLLGPHHRLVVEPGPHPLPIRGERSRLLRLLGNLLDNAIKYSPAGGEVRCEVEADADEVRVVIRDQGVGISDADQKQLFGRFARFVTDETYQIPGTGLGLYLCRQIARCHGGDVTARSKLGQGSELTMTLPRPSYTDIDYLIS